MTGTAHDHDEPASQAGGADVVCDAFEQMPAMMASLAGPDLRLTAMNAACREFLGRSDLIGRPVRQAFPEMQGQQIFEMLDRVYATGNPETGHGWRAQVYTGAHRLQEVYVDFVVAPSRAADGTITGVLITSMDASLQVLERQAMRRQAEGAEERYEAARDVVAGLQEALLPTALPVLPQARIAARYLVAGDDQAAGGDWFDAITLESGAVALIVGDVVGHGVVASAAMGQLRAVLNELLLAEPDLARVLQRADAFAARTPTLCAATLALAVLDPRDGTMQYATCGHLPPLIVGADTSTRFLDATGTGPLGTGPPGAGQPPVLATVNLAPGELVLLYSDGLVERPNRTMSEAMAELATVAADAAANRALPAGAPAAPADRVCQLTVELLTRTGYADDVTTLAAQRLAAPAPGLRLELPVTLESVAVARSRLADWLEQIDALPDDRDSLQLAVVEVVTNAVEHAYPPGEQGLVELDAELSRDGRLSCRITDHGVWKEPPAAMADRGHGLMVAGQVVDDLVVSHPPQPAGTEPGARGTVVTLRHRLSRPAILASGTSARAAQHFPEPPFAVELGTAGSARHAAVCGPVDITTADRMARRLLAAARGGTLPLTVDLTSVSQLASAGVRALYQVKGQLAAHGQKLTLVAAPGSSAGMVLDLVRLPHAAAGAGHR